MDIPARRAEARQKAEPHRSAAKAAAADAAGREDRLRELRRNLKTARTEIEAAELRQTELEENAKAQTIENAAFDLNAVNPTAQAEEDDRTPALILDVIEAKGREIAEALAALRA